MTGRIAILSSLWATFIVSVLPAHGQSLGVWQDLPDGRVAAGEPVVDAPIAPADPVSALPPVAKPQRFAGFSIARPTINPQSMAGLAAQPAPPGNLMQQNYDPAVPLPHPDLAEMDKSGQLRWDGPRPYVHVQQEEHGGGVLGLNGVLGLTVPFPTSRAVAP